MYIKSGNKTKWHNGTNACADMRKGNTRNAFASNINIKGAALVAVSLVFPFYLDVKRIIRRSLFTETSPLRIINAYMNYGRYKLIF